MKQLYIFDFDGTLVNTFHDSVIAYNTALKIHGKKPYEFDNIEEVDFTDFIESMTRDEEVLMTYGKEYEKSTKEHTKPYPGIKDTLIELDKQGVTLAICSNRLQEQLEMLDKDLFPHINFKYVIGYQEGCNAKPDPAMINKIIDNENFDNDEIVYIGDRLVDITTAKNVDIDVIIVTWGQGDEDAYTDNYPLKIIDNAEELLEL